jgi:glucose/arabinose dehydrogenase
LHAGQGGLLDVLVDPEFASNRQIFLSYAVGTREANATRVSRYELNGDQLSGGQTIYTATPDKPTAMHYGGRLLMLPDRSLLLSLGDGFDLRESAQVPQTALGKIVRFNTDGVPWSQTAAAMQAQPPGWRAELYSIGHRNPQGLAYDPERQLIYQHEHGPQGGDELNIIEAYGNYGWPIATFGKDYSGAVISPFNEIPSMALKQPLVQWTPSIAPSALLFYRGDAHPHWRGDLLITTLAGRHLLRVRLSGREVVKQERFLEDMEKRWRDLDVDAKGEIYLLSDGEDAGIYRLQ